jgi:branched-chain amino acid transport system ATP-binding protein
MLTLRNVTAGYGDTIVLRDVTLEVPASRAVALLGPNGAGKTTLLRVASGLIQPVSGQVVLADQDVTGQDAAALARKGLCHIPEGRGIFPSLTVRENLRLSAGKADEAECIERAVTAFPPLRTRMKQVAGSMSGGEQQMLAISRAYIANPKVVLVDEASMGLAPIVVDALFEFLEQLEGALLLVEQYVTRALKLADTAYLISNGSIVNSGPAAGFDAQEIFASYLNIDVATPSGPPAPAPKQ